MSSKKGREEETGKIFEEIMNEKSPNLLETKNAQIPEVKQTRSTRHNKKKSTLRYVIINLQSQ